MARKKFYDEEAPVELRDSNNSSWKAGLYIRLSREDGDKALSDSIVNQKKMLKYFVEDHDDYFAYEYFIDENVTGTNFNRLAFQRMIEKIKNGTLNCVIVKDLSRFGRDYLGAGYYLENVFQKYNCRFISIIDDIDSKINKQMITGLMVRVKNLAHDNNSQNISLNVRRTKNSMRAKGKFLGLPPYGYKRDPDDKYHLVVDELVRTIVENIFDWYIQGNGVIKIAEKLNSLSINSKSEYKKSNSVYVVDKKLSYAKWRPNTVRAMLDNKVYVGAIAQRKETTANYKNRKRFKVAEKEQIIVYDMHEPIISKQKFDLVQNIIQKKCFRTASNRNKVHLFSGFLKCNDCNSSMIRNSTYQKGKTYTYYKCRAYNQQGTTTCLHSHSIKHEQLYYAVLLTINKHISTLIQLDKILKEIANSKSISSINIDYEKSIKLKATRIQKLRDLKFEAYTSWKVGDISKDEYKYANTKYDTELETLVVEKEKLEREVTAEEDIRNNRYDWLSDAIELGGFNKLTREILVTLIDDIYITKELGIRIVFKYSDEFERLSKYASSHIDDYYSHKEVAHA